ncbi:malonic semialdehyde reductase [Sphingorhabdus lutea]|uniref:Putative NADH dehydrogenase/NAD(P)H nitroreductase LPB140_09865 n=1 Tax=Sphingorhabdus lutea TaxID=1913578 RepID=A0A1L3JD39_9SPHN|nr:malonic semialdehyde reductase [Sphingorhabdus lutea]APG63044.1 malonic semialdehyde reductase [Sphingorhabdus lutea]
MTNSSPLSDDVMDQLFRKARTFNGYLDKKVGDDQYNAIWELMKFGPTSANCLPARMIWCKSDEAKKKLAACAMTGNDEKIIKAPVTVILGMDLEFYEFLPELFPHTDARAWFTGNDELIATTAMRNSSLQGAYFIMAARALGLDTGPMSGFDNAAVDAEFFAGTKIKSNFITTLGYGDESSIFERSPRPDFNKFNNII